jgi:hypothetical protein
MAKIAIASHNRIRRQHRGGDLLWPVNPFTAIKHRGRLLDARPGAASQ